MELYPETEHKSISGQVRQLCQFVKLPKVKVVQIWNRSKQEISAVTPLALKLSRSVNCTVQVHGW
jgi:hypothetical protein